MLDHWLRQRSLLPVATSSQAEFRTSSAGVELKVTPCPGHSGTLGLLKTAWKGCADGSFAAFVVGVSAYPEPLTLPPCEADAVDMANLLHRLGYTVTRLINPGFKELAAAFGRFVGGLHAGATVVLYISGHGFQRDGANFLIPQDGLWLGTGVIMYRSSLFADAYWSETLS